MDQSRQLLCACEQGDVNEVQVLLEHGCEVDCLLDEEENTALQVASANGYEQVVRLLIIWGAGLDKCNVFGWTSLLHAARYGHLNVVRLLNQYQADLHCKTRFGASAVTLAAKGGHIQVVKFLIESGVDLNSSIDGSEFMPLLVAAQYGHDAVLRTLLDRGCNVNSSAPTSKLTPLMTAAVNGHMTTAQILIERGADPNITNACDQTALEIASARNKREVRGYLERKTTNKPKMSSEDIKPDIIKAARQGDIQRVRDILDKEPNEKDANSPQDGATPLMFAAMTGRLDIAELLVLRGCDVNKQDFISGWTALMQATYHGKKNVAMFLLSIGADVNIQAKNGCSAFDMASLIDDVDTELLRHLAAKAMEVTKLDKTKKVKSKSNEVVPIMATSELSPENESPKSGLKGWWNRMSNRFRNLKLGRTFGSTNRLAPLETSASVQDLTLKTSVSAPQVQSARLERKSLRSPDSVLTMTSYDSMLLETKQNASLYTLDISTAKTCPAISSDTLKPVIPPFLPAPKFALDSGDASHRVSTNFQALRMNLDDDSFRSRPVKIGTDKVTSSKDANIIDSNGNLDNNSPSSSGGSSNISALQAKKAAHRKYAALGKVRPNDSTPNNDVLENGPVFANNRIVPGAVNTSIDHDQAPSKLFMPRKSSTMPSAFRVISSTTSPNSSTSGSSSITPKRSSRGRSTSSKGSTTSTLTPSPSPTPGKNGEDIYPVLDSLQEKYGPDEELASILKKLSLEKYNPIFEEQEVDMEAFLTLTDGDLKELGISHTEPRKQILSAINDLRSGKESGVGKSSIVMRFVADRFKPALESTIGASFMTKTVCVDGSTYKFQIWDTAGQEKYRALAPMYYRGSAAAVIVYDVTRESSFQAVKSWVHELQRHGPHKIVIAIAGNKCDLEDLREVREKDAQEYARDIGAIFCETSAMTSVNISDLFDTIARLLPPEELVGASGLHGSTVNLRNANQKKKTKCCGSSESVQSPQESSRRNGAVPRSGGYSSVAFPS